MEANKLISFYALQIRVGEVEFLNVSLLVGEGDCAIFGYTPGWSWSHCCHMVIVFFQVLIKLIKPYTRIKIGFISGELNIDPNDVESLLVSCILDNTIYGRIDQVRLIP